MSEDMPNRRARRQGCHCGHPYEPGWVHAADRCHRETPAERIRRMLGETVPEPPTPSTTEPQVLRDTLADFAEEMRRLRNAVQEEDTRHYVRRSADPPLPRGTTYESWRALRDEALFGMPPTPYPTPYPMGPDEQTRRNLIAAQRADQEIAQRARRVRPTPNPESYNGDLPPAPHRREPMDHEHNRVSQAQMDEAFADLESKSKGELLDLIRDMRQDWATLNDIHNRRAQRSGWCTEYEERQDRHNTSLKVFKLLGRHHGDPADDYPDDQGGL